MKIMKLPKTTKEKPYIEFSIDKKGKMKLSASSSWWGGKNCFFWRSNDTEGNTCNPKDLEKYIDAFKKRKIKSIEKEIETLNNQLQNVIRI